MAPRRYFSAWLAAGAVWALVAVLPACAARQEWIYAKPRASPAQLDQDKAACRQVAPSHSMFRTFQAEKVERAAFNRCMASRGYTITVAPLP